MNNYENLQKVLKEIFEMDKADLDFGIYRIMNQKREQVMQFIDTTLPKDIKEILAQTQSKDTVSLQAELEQMGKALDSAGVVREEAPKYIALQQQIAGAVDTNTLEQEVFSHLASFFKRYYKDGDFISLRRYKKDVYSIPYEGEEVKLHWANHDQYYIKTSEYLKNYAFKLSDDKKVNFVLKEASTEQNNNKTQDGERRFAIHKELPLEIVDGELIINFTYETHPKSTKQDDLAKQALETIQAIIPGDFVLVFDKASTEKNKARTLLEKHINNFISRNSFDYFIHKNLGVFLNRELDFYIKNEVLFIDDINTENPIYFTAQLSKIKALKTVANKIITFLAQIEDFQKKLWLKKKFVISTNYCITLDRIPETYYPEIFANQAQIKEWKTLFDLEITDVSQLVFEQYLVLDTKNFSQEFKDKLLAEFDDLDEETDGSLINSENFQALNLLKEKFNEKIDSIYIDPPYNSNASKIAYKNDYEHSSWLSLMNDRIGISREFISTSGILQVAIDDIEFTKLELLVKDIFGIENFIGNVAIMNNPKGRDSNFIATSHEYTILAAKEISQTISNRLKLNEKEIKDKYPKKDEHGNLFRELPLRRSGSGAQREDRPFMYFPILVKDNQLFSIPTEEYTKIFNNRKFDDDFVLDIQEKYTKDGYLFILPMRSDGSKGRWRWGFESCKEGILNESLIYKGNTIYQIDFADDTYLPKSLWYGESHDSSTKGTNLLTNLIPNNPFDYPKSLQTVIDFIYITSNEKSIILDYFGGSGTTAHAIINLNREKGKRKYLLVEMGTYFNNVTKPRIQKVIYSDNWKNGKPQDKAGISQLFKYQVLESYEDTLNNLSLNTTNALGLLQFNQEAQEEYLLSYMLDVESDGHLFNLEAFKNPFGYQLNVTENNELVPTTVDLVETFNYLIGLYVQRIQRVKDIKLVEGKTRTGEKTLVIWRNLETTSNDETEKVFRKLYDSVRSAEFDQIYINGDHHFENARTGDDQFKVKLIEESFFKLMFNQTEL